MNDDGDRFHLERVPLDRQGYTRDGQYFGTGAPLYNYYTDDYSVAGHVRAYDRKSAKTKIRAEIRNPRARFYR